MSCFAGCFEGIKKSQDLGKVKLHYFNVFAKGPAIALALHHGGLDWEGVFPSNWKDLKPTTPFGELPILEVQGKMIGHEFAILSYLAKCSPALGGANDEEYLISLQIASQAEDIYQKLGKYQNTIGQKDKCSADELRAFWEDTDTAKHSREYGIHAYLQYLEKFYIKIAGKGGNTGKFTASGVSVGECKLFTLSVNAPHAGNFGSSLNHSGHTKFKSIDVKLGVAMTAMLNASGDQAADLYLDVNRKANHCVRSLSGKIINGRHIIAMSYESCRTRDRLDMLVTLEYLIKSQYQGDSKMNVFKQMWPEDSPVLRMVLLVHYEMVTYDVPKRSYQTLLGLIDRCIMRQREQKNMRQTQVDLRLMIEGKDQMAAPAKTKGNEKARAGKGKKQRDTSESTDGKGDRSEKQIRCKFFFSPSGECRNGDKCPYSHSMKTPELGRDGSPSGPRSRSPSAGASRKICYAFKNNGTCSRSNCPFSHILVACSQTIVLSPAPQYVDDYGSMEDQPMSGGTFKSFEDYNGCREIPMNRANDDLLKDNNAFKECLSRQTLTV
ncbi:Glutathione S-transferase [Symbiodinium microadriaticum]|uniref:Glutathione S-transferase n=1 Tax=Symbiodinium microadriaticum TaxID=2951 RepID=A0A1Q9CBK2_SYMMI|nr:Glutathione S-transferase [Symbiodinium microadriaticum]CAE7780336.1 GstS1 [Symbiodinium microadriaticum]